MKLELSVSYSRFDALKWIETNALQLHRMACKGRGIGPWNFCEDGIPRTQEVGLKFSLERKFARVRRGKRTRGNPDQFAASAPAFNLQRADVGLSTKQR